MAMNGNGNVQPMPPPIAKPIKAVVQAREGNIDGLGYTYKSRIVTVNPQTDLPEIIAEVDIWVNDKKNLKGVIRALSKQIYEKETGITQVS